MKRIETFQNLVLIALADGEVNEAERASIQSFAMQLGLTEEEKQSVIEKVHELEFILPETKEEKANELYKLVLLALSDNDLDPAEYGQLKYFAEACGYDQNKLDNLIRYADSQLQKLNEAALNENLKQYDTVLASLRKSGKPDTELAKIIHDVIRKKELTTDLSSDQNLNHALYQFLWLMFCRFAKLNSGGIVIAAMSIELAELGEYTLDDIIYDFKLSEEGFFDGIRIQLDTADLKLIKEDLQENFPFNRK